MSVYPVVIHPWSLIILEVRLTKLTIDYIVTLHTNIDYLLYITKLMAWNMLDTQLHNFDKLLLLNLCSKLLHK